MLSTNQFTAASGIAARCSGHAPPPVAWSWAAPSPDGIRADRARLSAVAATSYEDSAFYERTPTCRRSRTNRVAQECD